METKNAKAAQNGQVKNIDTKNGVGKTETLKGAEEPKVIQLPVNPIEERTRKIAELQKLTNARHLLVEAEKDLHSFNFGSDKMRDALTIKDSDNNKFETSNTYIINRVVEELKKEFAVKIADVTAQLLAATI